LQFRNFLGIGRPLPPKHVVAWLTRETEFITMQMALSMLANMPRFGAEIVLWLAVTVGIILFHQMLNLALTHRPTSAAEREIRVD
jgi:hypothetical protein